METEALRSMPPVGMGTAVFPVIGSGEIKRAVVEAIELGYRHFDTGAMYSTEEPLGEAILEAFSRDLIKSRDELLITTKLWCSDAHAHLVVPALKKSLKSLQLEYIDLYLIHWPLSSRAGTCEVPIKKENLMAMDFNGVWAAMEDCVNLGLAKSIGVSNFSCKKLSHILDIAKIPPAVNQVEMNPLWQQKKLRDFCKSKGVMVMAYSPLGARGTIWGSNRVMENEILNEIANARAKSVAQVCLRWAYEQGVCMVVKSFNTERMKQNLDIFDWSLSEEETRRISEIPQYKACRGQGCVSDNGPFKTVEELWDGEI